MNDKQLVIYNTARELVINNNTADETRYTSLYNNKDLHINNKLTTLTGVQLQLVDNSNTFIIYDTPYSAGKLHRTI